jgi:hypothetical protein
MNDKDAAASTGQPFAHIRIGVRLAGTVAGQAFTGVVVSTGRRDGKSRVDDDGTWTEIEPGNLDSVSVKTDGPMAMPSGRRVSSVRIIEGFESLRLL